MRVYRKRCSTTCGYIPQKVRCSIYIYIYMHAGIPQKMLDHMRLYRKRCMEMLIYIYI